MANQQLLGLFDKLTSDKGSCLLERREGEGGGFLLSHSQ